MRFAESRSREAQESHVKVGILSGKGGKETNEDGISMLALGVIHELGAPAAGIPARSFIRRTFIVHERELRDTTAKLAGQFISGKLSLEGALGVLGAWGSTKVKQMIATWTWSESGGPLDSTVVKQLAQSTIDAKGSSRPLIDTGRLSNSITWQVWMGRARDAKGRFV